MEKSYVSKLVLALVLASLTIPALAVSEYPVNPGTSEQWYPDIDGDIVVWQQFDGNDWDVMGVDMRDFQQWYLIDLSDTSDQQNPVVSGTEIVWQDNYNGNWDIYGYDIDGSGQLDPVAVFDNDQMFPVIDSSVVAWQDNFNGDWDIYGAVIGDVEFPIAAFEGDQTSASISGNKVVWADDIGHLDIYVSDITNNSDVQVYLVAGYDANQAEPIIDGDNVIWTEEYYNSDIFRTDVSELARGQEFVVNKSDLSFSSAADVDDHLVVYQDDRRGDWDIFVYNMSTGSEYLLTDNSNNQMNPKISGRVVVWEDDRDGVWQIYIAYLDDPEFGKCLGSLAGDVDGNCIVDFRDIALLANNWMGCNLEDLQDCSY